MPNALFSAEEFTPTQWSTAQDKATFGNHFFRFIESGWKQRLFTRSFYNRLSSCFGHIAHYDLHGFYGTWFAEDALRLGFLQHTLRFSCCGNPTYTFSDVERAIKAELRRRPLGRPIRSSCRGRPPRPGAGSVGALAGQVRDRACLSRCNPAC